MQIIETVFQKIEEKGLLFSLIFISSLILHFFSPWWVCALVAFWAAFWQARSAGQAFAVGAAAIGLLWSLSATFWQVASAGILSNKVASLLQLSSGGQLLGVLTVIATLVGGNAALSGYLLRQVFAKPKA
jgi:hypothetical protein